MFPRWGRSASQGRACRHLARHHTLNARKQGEIGNNFSTRIQGTRIRHHMGPASLKLYDKAGLIARVECTAQRFPSSSTTATWNSATVRVSSSLPHCANRSTASATCANSCRPRTSATSPSWRASRTPTQPKKHWSRWPAQPRSRADRLKASTYSSTPTTASSAPSPAATGSSSDLIIYVLSHEDSL